MKPMHGAPADPVLTIVAPAIEAACKALLTGESQVITIRELRALVTKLDGLLRSDKRDAEKAADAMLAIRLVIDRAVAVGPLAFLACPLSRVLGKTHETLKGFVASRAETARSSTKTAAIATWGNHQEARSRPLPFALDVSSRRLRSDH